MTAAFQLSLVLAWMWSLTELRRLIRKRRERKQA
jgi:hypothetical protein